MIFNIILEKQSVSQRTWIKIQHQDLKRKNGMIQVITGLLAHDQFWAK